MTGDFPPETIDHINRVRDDNRWRNLRPVSQKENSRNQKIYSTNTSGISGVTWRKQDKVWRSTIGVANKVSHLGSFNNLFEACCVRKAAELKYGFHQNHGRKP